MPTGSIRVRVIVLHSPDSMRKHARHPNEENRTTPGISEKACKTMTRTHSILLGMARNMTWLLSFNRCTGAVNMLLVIGSHFPPRLLRALAASRKPTATAGTNEVCDMPAIG